MYLDFSGVPGLIVFNIVMDSLARDRLWRDCLLLLQRMADIGLKPNSRTFTTALKGLCNAQKSDAAFALLREMEESAHGKVLRTKGLDSRAIADGWGPP
jgi:pentatricopeptide repeat protein